MRILGIDPGFAIVGCGVVDYDNYIFSPVEYGAITTQAGLEFCVRIETIYDELSSIITNLKPDCVAVEKLFFTSNQKTVINVSQARGVILLACKKHNLPVFEYTPLQIKQAVVGYGKAEKTQVMQMTKRILKLKNTPKPDDVADALAVAICHGNCANSCAFNTQFPLSKNSSW